MILTFNQITTLYYELDEGDFVSLNSELSDSIGDIRIISINEDPSQAFTMNSKGELAEDEK